MIVASSNNFCNNKNCSSQRKENEGKKKLIDKIINFIK